jgi:hypothetical protein
MGTGQLDSQMVFIFGNTSGPPLPPSRHQGPLKGEHGRVRGLCKWIRENNVGGPGWGVEGVVRMNARFELIWCNFSSPSARLISNLNVKAPLLSDIPKRDADLDPAGVLGLRECRSLPSAKTILPLPSSTLLRTWPSTYAKLSRTTKL